MTVRGTMDPSAEPPIVDLHTVIAYLRNQGQRDLARLVDIAQRELAVLRLSQTFETLCGNYVDAVDRGTKAALRVHELETELEVERRELARARQIIDDFRR